MCFKCVLPCFCISLFLPPRMQLEAGPDLKQASWTMK